MSQKLTQKQKNAAYLLASGKTGDQVARALKVRRETISRWKQKPEFNVLFEHLLAEARHDTRQRLVAMVDQCIHVITNTVGSQFIPGSNLKVALNVVKMLAIEPLIDQKTVQKASNLSKILPVDTNVHPQPALPELRSPLAILCGD